MPIRTLSFISGAAAMLLVAGAVAFANADDPWVPADNAALDEPASSPGPDRELDPTPAPAAASGEASSHSLTPAKTADARAAWVDICTNATGDREQCVDHSRSDAWPFQSDDPLGELAARYGTPNYCDQFQFSDEGEQFCNDLASHVQG